MRKLEYKLAANLNCLTITSMETTNKTVGKMISPIS